MPDPGPRAADAAAPRGPVRIIDAATAARLWSPTERGPSRLQQDLPRLVEALRARPPLEPLLVELVDLVVDLTGAAAAVIDCPAQGGTGPAARLMVHRGLSAAEVALCREDRLGDQEGVVARDVPLIEQSVEARAWLAVRRSSGAPEAGDAGRRLDLLASAAGLLLDHLARLTTTRQREEWLDAVARIATMLVDRDADDAIATVAEHARRVTGADVAWVVSRNARSEWTFHALAGFSDDDIRRLALLDLDTSISARVIRQGETYIARGDEPEIVANRLRGIRPANGSAMLMPMGTPTGVEGLLGLGWPMGRLDDVRAVDPVLARSFLELAALSIRVSLFHQASRRTTVLDAEHTLARDLDERVINRLHALGLALDAERGRMSPTDRVAPVLEAAVSGLDETIEQIRRTVAGVSSWRPERSLTEHLEDIVDRSRGVLGFRPVLELRTTGPPTLDLLVAGDLLAVMEEALSNVGRHARATACEVVVTVDHEITVRVSDNGRGLPADYDESGLDNLRRRAVTHQGALRVQNGPAGCVLEWSVPRPPETGASSTALHRGAVP